MLLTPIPNDLEKLKWVAHVFANSHTGILITDAEGVVLDVNPSFTTITGFEREDIIGQTPRLLHSGTHGEDFYREMWRSLREKGSWQGEISNRRKDGRIVVELLAIHAIHDGTGRTTHYIGNFADLSQLRAYQPVQPDGHLDVLTQLPNQALLTDRIRQAIAWTQRQGTLVALCSLDINGFGEINERHGHAVGDAVLVEIAARLRASTREGDTVARLGSDTFVVLLADVDSIQEVELVLDRISTSLQTPLPSLQGGGITAAIGLSIHPLDSLSAEQMLDNAGRAMLTAKHLGGQGGGNSHYLFDPDQEIHPGDLHAGVPLLRDALNAGEFHLHYQPILDLKTSRIDGLEASLRWQHPERGLLRPEQIRAGIPYKLENSSLAIELDLWAIETALAQMRDWEKRGMALPVSLDISMRLLRWPEFPAYLAELVAQHPPAMPLRLELDMDDNAPLSDLTLTSRIIDEGSRLGVAFVLDNFGRGNASLTYLKYLPVQILKIDPSLVRRMLGDPGEMAVVESLLGMARAFDRKVVAAGVETTAQAKALWARGCYSAQGQGIAAPMPAEAVPDWFAHFRLAPEWICP